MALNSLLCAVKNLHTHASRRTVKTIVFLQEEDATQYSWVQQNGDGTPLTLR